jgi:hypothetical protein
MNVKHRFVMASTEIESFAEPRTCRVVAELASESRDDLVLIEMDPPVIGQGFGLGGEDIRLAVVASRLEGRALSELENCWPVPVYVLLMAKPFEGQSELHDEELSLVAWAEVYPSMAELATRDSAAFAG